MLGKFIPIPRKEKKIHIVQITLIFKFNNSFKKIMRGGRDNLYNFTIGLGTTFGMIPKPIHEIQM